MGLILCQHSDVTHPLYVSDLGVYIRSQEELCYVIFRYPLLVLDGFVDDAFMEFISDDLNMSDYLRRMEKSGGHELETDEILYAVLEYSDLYTKSELAAYKEQIRSLRNLQDEEYALRKADFMFEILRYGQAIRYYNKALRAYGDGTGPSFASVAARASSSGDKQKKHLARIYGSIGDAQANLMLYRDAYESYSRAHIISSDVHFLKKIYFLSLVDTTPENRKIYAAYLGDKVEDAWDEEYEAAVHDVNKSTKNAELDDIFDKDSVKRKKAISDILDKWKREYRNML